MKMKTAVGEFLNWLPGELHYSAEKASYPAKIERAKLPIDDPRSIYGFLGAEWHHFQLLRNQGKHHSKSHEKTAQLQLAKFTAGIFDKAALLLWWNDTHVEEPDPERSSPIGAVVSHLTVEAKQERPFGLFVGDADELMLPFDQTLFSGGIRYMMKSIVRVADSQASGEEDYPRLIYNAVTTSIGLGEQALGAYLTYAESDLNPEQYELAPSILS